MKATVLFIAVAVLLSFLGAQAKEAAVYIDDGNGSTVKEILSPEESIKFSETLRQTMGLPDHKKFKLQHTSRDASAPRFMRDIYNTLDDLGIPRDTNMDPEQREVLKKADTVVTFTSKLPPVRMIPAPPHHNPRRVLYFDTSEVPLENSLLSAELRIHYSNRKPQYMDQHLKEQVEEPKILHVYLIVDDEGGEIKLGDYPLEEEGWKVVNITTPCLAWILQPNQNRGVRLAVTSEGKKHEDKLKTVGVSTAHDEEDHVPILVVFFSMPNEGAVATVTDPDLAPHESADSEFLSRQTRSLPLEHKNMPDHHHHSSNTNQCKMWPMYVSFTDLDWQNWVIAPSGYDANFCQGGCDFPMPAEVNATNHAIVQTLIKVLGVTQNGTMVPGASCAPKDLLTISVLYFDYNNNVVLKKYPKMVVKNCACK